MSFHIQSFYSLIEKKEKHIEREREREREKKEKKRERKGKPEKVLLYPQSV